MAITNPNEHSVTCDMVCKSSTRFMENYSTLPNEDLKWLEMRNLYKVGQYQPIIAAYLLFDLNYISLVEFSTVLFILTTS